MASRVAEELVKGGKSLEPIAQLLYQLLQAGAPAARAMAGANVGGAAKQALPQGSGGATAEAAERKAGAYEQGAEKALKESGYNDMTEAVTTMGGPGAQFALEKMRSDLFRAEGALQGQNPREDVRNVMGGQRKPVSGKPGFYEPARFDPNTGEGNGPSLLYGLITENPADMVNRTQANLNVQKSQGKEPLQAKDAATLQTEVFKAVLDKEKAGLLKPNDLFDAFNKASGPFTQVRDSMSRIEASATNPTPAGDLSLIYNYMKILDPGARVTEGDYANATNAGGVPEHVRNLYNKVMTGKPLSPKLRTDFVSRSRKLFKSSEDQQAKTVSEYTKLAKRNGIDPSAFITDMGLAGGAAGKQQVGRFTVEEVSR